MPKRIPGVVLVLIILFALVACGGNGSHICASASSTNCLCLPVACPVQMNAYVYAIGLNGQVAAFPIDNTTGALKTPIATTGPSASLGMAVIDGAYLYASNPVPEIGASIDGWSILQTTGALTAVPGSPFSLGPFTLANGLAAADNLRSAGPFLYLADAGKIDALKVDTNSGGSLSVVPGSPFVSGTNLYLATDHLNRFVFAADEDPPGGVLAFTIDSTTGALTAVPGSPFPISSSSSGVAQLSQIVVDPSGNFVYVALTSTNQVAAFAIASTGALTPVPGSPFAAGKGPLALATFNNSPHNNFLYVANALGGTISGYSIDSSSGVLTPLSGSPFAIPAAALASDLSGGHLYVSSAAGMLSFSINPTTGALLPIGLPVSFTGATVMTYVQ